MTIGWPAIEFAPLNVPLSRRKETLGASLYTSMAWVCLSIFIFLFFTPLQPLLIVYLGYIFYDKTSEQGARGNKWFRNLAIWKWSASYFPTQLIIETPLDPTRNYIFGYHPHGILGIGAIINFGSNSTGVEEKLPGLNIRVLTLAANLIVPFYREILLYLNFASVSKPSIMNILNKGPGNSCLIVVGGAQEALSAKPGLCDLVLKNRFGFVKVALETGAYLVPVFGFGENNLYNQIDVTPGSALYKFQTFFKKWFGFTIPFCSGRGFFNYTFGTLPKRHPLDVIVGLPIPVVKDPNPSQEKIQAVHQEYLNALQELYLRHQAKYFSEKEAPLMRFI